MVEVGEYLTFTLKPLDNLTIGHRLTHDLEPDSHREFAVVAFRQKYCAHTAAADLANYPVISEVLLGVIIFFTSDL